MRQEFGAPHYYDSRYGQYETHLAAGLQFPNGRHNHESVEDTLFIGKRRQDPFEATAYPLHIMDIEGELTKDPHYRRNRIQIAKGFVASDGSDEPSYYKRPAKPYVPEHTPWTAKTHDFAKNHIERRLTLPQVRAELAKIRLESTVPLVVGAHPNGNGRTNGHEAEVKVPVQKA